MHSSSTRLLKSMVCGPQVWQRSSRICPLAFCGTSMFLQFTQKYIPKILTIGFSRCEASSLSLSLYIQIISIAYNTTHIISTPEKWSKEALRIDGFGCGDCCKIRRFKWAGSPYGFALGRSYHLPRWKQVHRWFSSIWQSLGGGLSQWCSPHSSS